MTLPRPRPKEGRTRESAAEDAAVGEAAAGEDAASAAAAAAPTRSTRPLKPNPRPRDSGFRFSTEEGVAVETEDVPPGPTTKINNIN